MSEEKSIVRKVEQYHRGELAAQNKAGTRGAAAELARGKDSKLSFSSGHDRFIAAQSFAILASVNVKTSEIWVTPLFGERGDIQAQTENQLSIAMRCIPQNDPIKKIENGAHLSLLCIDLNKRTRHRINGIANNIDSNNATLSLCINEYAPNCPKYINRRKLIKKKNEIPAINTDARQVQRNELTQADSEFIQTMDTLWIGSFAPEGGADCNHRGGKLGFVRVVSPNTIEWPEYRGNGMFFTSGNLEICSRAGVTLLNFETGDILQMTGNAMVDWEHDGSYEGATRKITFHIKQIIYTENVTNHRWERLDYSPYNPVISGVESEVENSEYPKTATLVKIVSESSNIKTFRFIVADRIAFLPGQYATFEFSGIPNGSKSEIRTWTLSESPNSIIGDNTLDITVKRVPKGLVTNWLHDNAQIGLQVKLNGIQGELTAISLDEKYHKPCVPENLLLISAGIGITPNLAMIRGIGAFSLQESCNITMVHVDRTESDVIRLGELKRRASTYPNFTLNLVLTGEQGRLTKDGLASLVSKPQHQSAFICGPAGFMNTMIEYLVTLGVKPQNIHTESFDF
ncbi:FAD-binding oxidoreductase [Agaribacter flavus]|uniref:Pyridoxamine 5'-phosphate oxidase family protein n=1 Tax=Agaribacter flavus TaxID=1902781 RepID=A0ABV7FIA4_9ALTE